MNALYNMRLIKLQEMKLLGNKDKVINLIIHINTLHYKEEDKGKRKWQA